MAPRILLIVFVFLSFTAPAEAKWSYYRSPNFELYADGSQARAKDILNHFEQVRDLLSRIVGSEVETDRPVRIIAFSSEAAFKKVYKGGESTYAFYTKSRDRNYIVFQELDSDVMYEVGIHEYLHLITSRMGLPVWLSEGLSELYSTAYALDTGVRIGRPSRNVKSAGVGTALSMEELLTASRSDSKLWNNRNRVITLYTKGWALTSMLSMQEAYRAKFSEFLSAVVGGEKSQEAILQVWGKTPQDLERDLSRHLRGFMIPVLQYDTSWDKTKQVFEPRPVESAEESLMLADLLAVLGRRDEAHAAYQAAAASDDLNAEAHGGVGRTAPDEEAALSALARAAQLGSDNPYVHMDYASALLRKGAGESVEVAQALAKVVELRPNLAEPHLLLAGFARQAGDHGRELLELRRAKDVDPASSYARAIWMAHAALDAGSEVQARVAAADAARYVHSERQLDEVERLLLPVDSPGGGSFAQVDAWIAAGEFDSAAAALVEMQKRYPNARPIYERFADVQQRRGEAGPSAATAAEARKLRHEAVFNRKRSAEDAYRRINLLDAAGFYERSQIFFDALLELDPDNSGLLNNRAYELAEKGILLDRAIEMAERAMKTLGEERSDYVRDTLGWAYAKAQRNEEALKIFEQLVKEDRKSAAYQFHYGVVLGQLNRREEALRAFGAALESKTIGASFRKEIEKAREEMLKAPGA